MFQEKRIDKLFKALADAKRREIFHLLIMSASALTLTQLSNEFEISRQGVTKHVDLLKDAGLISIKSVGRQRFCSVEPRPLSEIKEWLEFYEKFWDNKMNDLSNFLDKES